MNWMCCKWLQFIKGANKINVKNSLDEATSFASLTVVPNELNVASLQPLYAAPLPIASAKYKDLQYLCSTLAIPEEFHSYYKQQNGCASVRDRLDESDVEEGSDYDVSDDDVEATTTHLQQQDFERVEEAAQKARRSVKPAVQTCQRIGASSVEDKKLTRRSSSWLAIKAGQAVEAHTTRGRKRRRQQVEYA